MHIYPFPTPEPYDYTKGWGTPSLGTTVSFGTLPDSYDIKIRKAQNGFIVDKNGLTFVFTEALALTEWLTKEYLEKK